MNDTRIPTIDMLVHEDLVGYVRSQFGEITAWDDED